MDLGGNTSVRPLIELFAALGRPVVAICYGVEVLIQATDPKTKVPLVWGRLVTGHSEQDDYTDGTTDVPVEGGYGPNYGSAPMTLEQMIKQYTGPQGGFISRNGSPYMAVVDAPFITARTTPDGYPARVAGPRATARGRAAAGEVCRGLGRPRSRTARLRRFAGSASKQGSNTGSGLSCDADPHAHGALTRIVVSEPYYPAFLGSDFSCERC